LIRSTLFSFLGKNDCSSYDHLRWRRNIYEINNCFINGWQSSVAVTNCHYPAGGSVPTISQFYQNYFSGFHLLFLCGGWATCPCSLLWCSTGEEFRRFDYGSKGNLQRYGQEEPPTYDLSQVKAPVYLYYADNDLLAPPQVPFYSNLLARYNFLLQSRVPRAGCPVVGVSVGQRPGTHSGRRSQLHARRFPLVRSSSRSGVSIHHFPSATITLIPSSATYKCTYCIGLPQLCHWKHSALLNMSYSWVEIVY